MDQEYIDYFLNRSGAVHEIECIEVSHPDFSQTYYVQSYDEDGLDLTHDGATHHYIYAPLRIDRANTSDDLDQKINITLGDLGEQISRDLKKIKAGSNAHIKPQVRYRLYRSDNLSKPLTSLQVLQVPSRSRDQTGISTFTAEATQLNNSKTGETYTLDRFPLLRGLL